MGHGITRREALIASSGLVLAACGTGQSGSSGDPDDVSIAWPSQPPVLDPVVVTTSSTATIGYNVFEGILALDADYAVQPVLAESWSVSDDYSEFTFVLRKGVSFQDGSPMRAEDVVASIEYWITVAAAGQQFFSEAEVTAPREDTVVIALPQTLYTCAAYLAQPSQCLVVMPKSSIEKAEGSTGVPQDHLIGTGPYAIESMDVDQSIVLKRFDGYNSGGGEPSGITGRKTPSADTLTFKIAPDATTRVNGIMSSQYDYASDIPADNAAQLSHTDGVSLNVLDSGILALVFNKKQGPFADQTLRQAVQMAINCDDVLVSSYSSSEYYDLNGALAAPTQKDWYTEAGLDAYNQHDLTSARQLVEQSDYDGKRITFLTTRDYPYMYNSAVVCADVLEKLGLSVDLKVTDWASELKLLQDPGAYGLYVSDFLKKSVPSAYSYLNPTYAGWTDDADLTEAIAQVNAATSPEEGLEALARVQEAHYRYVPAVKFGDIHAITAGRDRVTGFVPFIGPVFYNSRTLD